MVREYASKFTGGFREYGTYPTVSERESWEALPERWRRLVIAEGERLSGCDWTYITATDYMGFQRTGERSRFEGIYFPKRRNLNSLVLAECAEGKGRFIDDIINGVFSICDETAWTLPAHNSYVRDTHFGPLPDASMQPLDLFACETGAALAYACRLLGPALDEASPVVTRRIRYELSRRIFEPYLDYHFWWMGDGASQMNNWTVWCTQNVLLCAFMTEPSLPEEWGFAVRGPDGSSAEGIRRRIVEKAAASVDYFLDEYGDDGCCNEGAQYYRHAGLCLWGALEVLDTVTCGAFSPVWREEKIKNIAEYIQKVHISDKYYINFADCSPVAGRAGAREYLFGKRVGSRPLMAFAAEDFRAGGDTSLTLFGESDMTGRIAAAFAAKELYDLAEPVQAEKHDVYYPSAGVFGAARGSLFLAVKAGGNNDSHNHNDTGSFTVYKNGLPLVIDVGVETYSRKTFSSERYSIWTMQSAWHNLFTFDGVMQEAGERYRAKDVVCGLEDATIEMELSGAYPDAAGLESYRRSVSLAGGDEPAVTVRDSFRYKSGERVHEALLSLMTYDRPVAAPDGRSIEIADFTDGRRIASVSITGGAVFDIEEVPITDARLAAAWEHSIFRTRIRAEGGELALTIK